MFLFVVLITFVVATAGGLSPPPLRVAIVGGPASGKGTQCRLIREHFGLVHVSVGDILRREVSEGTPLGRRVASTMASGDLIPDEMVSGVVLERLAQSDCQRRGWLLDGFPRTAGQVRALAQAGHAVDSCIVLDVADAVLVRRAVGRRLDPRTGAIYHLESNPPPIDDAPLRRRLVQRPDDTLGTVKRRIAEYHKHADAICSSYDGVALHLDGSGGKDGTFRCVQKRLDAIVAQRRIRRRKTVHSR